jgi:hypothetical protein
VHDLDGRLAGAFESQRDLVEILLDCIDLGAGMQLQIIEKIVIDLFKINALCFDAE